MSAAKTAARTADESMPEVGSTPAGAPRRRRVEGHGERPGQRGQESCGQDDHGVCGARDEAADHPRGADGEKVDERGQPERPHEEYVDDQPSEEGPHEATLEAQRHRPNDGDDEDEIEASAT